jgi:hypothetical protein
MEPHGQAQRTRCVEQPIDLRGGKGDPFAEGVDGIDQAFARKRGQPMLGQFRDIAIGIAHPFGRQGMGAQERGDDMDRAHRASLRAARSIVRSASSVRP